MTRTAKEIEGEDMGGRRGYSHVSRKKLDVARVGRPLPEREGARGRAEALGTPGGAVADADVEQ